ncbi:hypothetical protein IQE94_12825 [Synechocystis sp. PCC 7339]|uniref:FHA domain-containing protein n=1 Tax=unclassified Synechocystis TaxID=2640012 RepID=UPI001BB0A785|nr:MULTISPECIES: FHA domain-containing protein [unclassified Synechocystis]QUS60567.1 hypothetical protein HTZ78_07700 [Synechocystis sp. PCC 7338]UAJ71988.1 hypothetical protein IQE94_12825 [Synechocystis sp. PCC 7339]
MYSYYPELKIKDPQGNVSYFKLNKRYPETRYSIGRYGDTVDRDGNDIVLPDNEKKLITRWDHCILSRESGGWVIKDNSTWGTSIIRNGYEIDLKAVKDGKEYLLHEDVIKIQDWQLQFLDLDPDKTKKPVHNMIVGPWVFSVSELSLYEMVNGQRIKVNLAPQEERLLCFMAKRNLENNKQPTVCLYEELIEAMLGYKDVEIEKHKPQIHNLIKNIRKRMKKIGEEDKGQWLRTESKIGYSLRIYCE